MWSSLGRFILKHKTLLTAILLLVSLFLGYHASKVEMSYEFTRAIPTDHPKYRVYQEFRKTFGEDGNLMVIALQTDRFFTPGFFSAYRELATSIKAIPAVEDVLSVPSASNLVKDTTEEKLIAKPVFPQKDITAASLDSAAAIFRGLPFYEGLLYNSSTGTYLMAIRINKDVLNSKARNAVVGSIVDAGNAFGRQQGVEMHYSGLPLIRTNLATKVAEEMKWFLIGSIIFSALILVLFFRSLSTTFLSLSVVIIGVVWSLGMMHLFHYKITLLNALIPPLVVVIGIPNCIYFLNKYHTSLRQGSSKEQALVDMIGKMGVVTLFCNITAAIGFAVFALTESAILKEFGVIAGINILCLFFISLIVIPTSLYFLSEPAPRHLKYLDNPWLLSLLRNLERWSLHHQKLIYGATAAVLLLSITGMFRLRSEGFIVDDLPKTDPIYKDLKFVEHHFKGVMPLEVVIDTKQKRGLSRNLMSNLERMDSFSRFISGHPSMARPLSILEGLKFARQAYWGGDSSNYTLPNSFDLAFLSQYLSSRPSDNGQSNNLSRILRSFMDSSRQRARISINMADIGSQHLPLLLDTLQKRSEELFDTSRYKVEFTGTSVTFLAGSAFIIEGLKESIFWAFLLIALCMLYLFRSLPILIASLIPNVIPLVITAGVMGWTGVAIKPSTVLIFSVALGIAIDITIRFLVNYKQELKGREARPAEVVIETIHKTGISIIYTSLVLIAGFVLFCFSGFGGTQALGWLTSLTLIMATIINLILLPVLLLGLHAKKGRS